VKRYQKAIEYLNEGLKNDKINKENYIALIRRLFTYHSDNEMFKNFLKENKIDGGKE